MIDFKNINTRRYIELIIFLIIAFFLASLFKKPLLGLIFYILAFVISFKRHKKRKIKAEFDDLIDKVNSNIEKKKFSSAIYFLNKATELNYKKEFCQNKIDEVKKLEFEYEKKNKEEIEAQKKKTKEYIINKYSQKIFDDFENKEISIGMNKEIVEMIFDNPIEVNNNHYYYSYNLHEDYKRIKIDYDKDFNIKNWKNLKT